VGRAETPLDPTAGPVAAFAHELRRLRRAAGSPSYRALARRAGYSPAALSAAAGGTTFPSLSVTLAYVGACGGPTEEWADRWCELDAKLAAERADPGAPAAGPPAARIPRELPPDVYAFTGRAGELAELDRILDEGDPATVVVAVSGTAGVGKTALAVHWAHRVAGRYPDGQLYVDLHGYGPEQPTEPGEVLAGFLRALGVPALDVPYELAERSALYRSLLADRAALILLDNAASAEAVRPLLPGSRSCLVLVTSRDALPGLVARDGARRIDLPLLPPHEALELMSTLVGARVAGEPSAAEQLVAACARLPLALRVAAELAVARPASRLAELVTELGDEQSRLDRLDAGTDERTAVGTVLSWSYHRLPPPAATLFRWLGLHPGPDLDAPAAAALAGTATGEARRLLDVLVRAHLVEPLGPAGYGQHDLLRGYAARRAAQEDPPDDRRAAVTRLLDHYLASAVAAMDVLVPAQRDGRPRGPWTAPAAPAPVTPADARAWLDGHRAVLATAIGFSAGRGFPWHAWQLAETVWWYQDARGYHPEALATQRFALAAARARGDRPEEASTLHHIGTIFRRWGRYAEAAEHFRQALAIQRETGDEAGVGQTLAGLGVLYRRQGRLREAMEHYRQALDIHGAVGDRLGTGWALGNLGIVHDQLGRYAEAVEYHRQALDVLRELQEWAGVAITLGNLGVTYGWLGRYPEAVDHLEQSLAMLRENGDRTPEADFLHELGLVQFRWEGPERAYPYFTRALAMHRELGNREGEAVTLACLGLAYAQAERWDEALRHSRQALDIAREIGDRRVEGWALDGVGKTLGGLGQWVAAGHHHEAALALAEQLDDRYGRARALDGLARTRLGTGDLAQARRYWEEALAQLAGMAVPEADELRERLADLNAKLSAH
jgi:tetratricopeptide (TPR) repeat protein/transcriptional regulator with XRE-family HTH domain